MYRTLPTALAVFLLTSWHTAAPAQAPQELILKAPDWANALVLVDLKGLMNSPLAQREGWPQRPMLETLGGALPFPKGADAVMLAAHLEPGTLKSSADLALIQGGQLPTLQQLARQEQRAEGDLAGVPSVASAKNSYFIALQPTTLAVFAPAHRQDAARWVRFAQQNKTPAVSPYLLQAANALKDGYHVVVALDLTDAVDPNLARKFLTTAPALKDKKVDLDALVKVISSVRGLRIGVRIDQDIRATLAGDFGEEVQPFADVLPSLLLNALDEMGGELDEFPAGNASFHGKTFMITNQLSQQGLRKVLGLVPPVTAPVAVAREAAPKKDAPAPAPLPGDDAAALNRRYFSSVYHQASEAHKNAEKRNDFVRAATLYEKAAAQIDKIPTANVDPELITFAHNTAVRLRDIAEALKAVYVEANQLEGRKRTNIQVVPGGFLGGFTIGPWNPYNPGDPNFPRTPLIRPYITPDQYFVQSNEPLVNARQQEILNKGLKNRSEIWRQITDDVGAVRKNMSAKYQIAF